MNMLILSNYIMMSSLWGTVFPKSKAFWPVLLYSMAMITCGFLKYKGIITVDLRFIDIINYVASMLFFLVTGIKPASERRWIRK